MKLKVASVIGTRPNLTKFYRFFEECELFEPVDMIYTGQHYDESMKGVFFEGLQLPKPTIDLSVTKPGEMLDSLMVALKGYDMVIVYGDTHSSLMGALAASYLQIPVVHIEAGVRSNNMSMPEEINRRAIDAISTLKMCPCKEAYDNLFAEGNAQGAYVVGDVMFDTLARLLPMGRPPKRDKYLLTLHRPSNVDNPEKLSQILRSLKDVDGDIIFPVHPRTRANLNASDVPENVKMINPVSYLKMIDLIYDAKKVITDSGGVQKESFWLTTPCLTLRNETEWVDTLQSGWNQLVTPDNLVQKIQEPYIGLKQEQPYGHAKANENIEKVITQNYAKIKDFKKA